MTADPDVIALCAALDGRCRYCGATPQECREPYHAGGHVPPDDSALPALADRLEELGDERAAGLRRRIVAAPRAAYGKWQWRNGGHPDDYVLAPCVFDRLRGGERGTATPARPDLTGAVYYVAYPSRSAAFLALAQALAGAPTE